MFNLIIIIAFVVCSVLNRMDGNTLEATIYLVGAGIIVGQIVGE